MKNEWILRLDNVNEKKNLHFYRILVDINIRKHSRKPQLAIVPVELTISEQFIIQYRNNG